MRFRIARHLPVPAVLAVIAACSDTSGPPPETGFRTAQPALAVGLSGATVEPILTVGDTVPGGFVYPPTPDGLGGYTEGGRLILFNSHETGLAGVPGADGTAKFTYARVSRLVLDRTTATVLSGSLVVDGPAGYRNFCSATFVTAREGMPGGWFLTGEETMGIGKDGILRESGQLLILRAPGS